MAQLPAGGKTPWPPISERNAYIRYGEWSAWYSGSPQELTRFYAGYAGQDRTGFFDPQTTAQPFVSIWRRFFWWARQDPAQITRTRIHIPAAADISVINSDLLFGDAPKITIPEAHMPKPKLKTIKIADRMEELIEEDAIFPKFLEAAEIASALGGVFIGVMWDKEIVEDRPILYVKHPDAAIPEFRMGVLASVIFWDQVDDDGKNVWRHLELHTKGKIEHALYQGSSIMLGDRVALTKHPLAKGYADLVETTLDDLDCAYIPNMRPNRADRRSFLGRSDYAGSEGLMDALDETWSSWMRDIRLAKARLMVPEEFIRSLGRGHGGQFDLDQEIWEQMKIQPVSEAYKITPQQFLIRHLEHQTTAESLLERIISTAGFSATTFGLHGEVVEKTATEVKSKEHRSIVTRGKKIEYWAPAIADILEAMLEIDAAFFSGPGSLRPRADFPEQVEEDLLSTAQAIKALREAKAISDETAVEMAHPNWDPEEVQDELDKMAKANEPISTVGGNENPGEGAPPVPGAPFTGPAPVYPGPMPPGTGGGPAITPPISQPAR